MKVQYSVPLEGSKKDGNTAVYRNPKFTKELACFPDTKTTNIQQLFVNIVEKIPNQNCLGTLNKDKTGYTWKSYSQIKSEAEKIGSGMLELNLAPQINEYEDYHLRLVGVYAKNREEWLVLDISNALYRGTMVPLYDTLGPETISYVIGHSNMEVLFVEKSSFKGLWQADSLHNLKTIVSFDKDLDKADIEKAESKGLKLLYWEDVMKASSDVKPYADVKPDDCFTFSYTSGTTGNPKGAMISHRNFMAVASGADNTSLKPNPKDVHLSYLPLPHIFERLIVISLLYFGAQIGFFGGDMLKLKDDLAVLKPTLFVSVPRLYNKFYDRIKAKLDDASGCKKCLVDKAVTSKMEGLKKPVYTSGMWDGLVFGKTKVVLGGNVTRMLVGSAPISGKILEFMKMTMCCPFIEGYGQTESTGASFATDEKDPEVGHVGGVLACLEFKLEDVPDMNCTSEDQDKETGKAAPRGEVCMRGNTVFLGYYKDRAKTDETIDSEGWLHTGDVGTILPNGGLKIIDRKKNIFKLSQGEYVSPEKVENMYIRARGVAECFLHGDSLQNFAVGILVADPDAIKLIAQENKISFNTVAELCVNEQIKEIILKNVTVLGKNEGLKGFEQAKRIWVTEKPFADWGCQTNTMKLQRHNAKNVFQQQIGDMYALGEPVKK